MKRSQQFVVSVPVVPGVTKAAMAQYIRRAVEIYCWAVQGASEYSQYGNLRGQFRGRERSKVSVRALP